MSTESSCLDQARLAHKIYLGPDSDFILGDPPELPCCAGYASAGLKFGAILVYFKTVSASTRWDTCCSRLSLQGNTGTFKKGRSATHQRLCATVTRNR